MLAELDARLTAGPGRPGPHLIDPHGLGGAGKTSVALEYAHRHLAEVAVCWQFPAEDSAVLAAEFAVLADQLGARERVDSRDPMAAVHAVLACQEAGWLMVFDNAPDRAAIESFLPPAGPGRVLITTQNQHWLPGQALEVPVLDRDIAADFLHPGHRHYHGQLPADVPRLFTEQTADLLDPEVAGTVRPLLGDPIATGDAIAASRRYSLASPAGNGLLVVHRLVQTMIHSQLSGVLADSAAVTVTRICWP